MNHQRSSGNKTYSDQCPWHQWISRASGGLVVDGCTAAAFLTLGIVVVLPLLLLGSFSLEALDVDSPQLEGFLWGALGVPDSLLPPGLQHQIRGNVVPSNPAPVALPSKGGTNAVSTSAAERSGASDSRESSGRGKEADPDAARLGRSEHSENSRGVSPQGKDGLAGQGEQGAMVINGQAWPPLGGNLGTFGAQRESTAAPASALPRVLLRPPLPAPTYAAAPRPALTMKQLPPATAAPTAPAIAPATAAVTARATGAATDKEGAPPALQPVPAAALHDGAPQPQQGGESILTWWQPTPGQYLLAQCYYGRWSNHLYCMEHALVLAAALNRTLLMPSKLICSGAEYHDSFEEDMVGLEHLKSCLNEHTPSRASVPAPAPVPVPKPAPVTSLVPLLSNDAREGWRLGLDPRTGSGSGSDVVRVMSMSEYLSAAGIQQLEVDMVLCSPPMCPPPEVCPSTSDVKFPVATITAELDWCNVPIGAAAVAELAKASAGKPVVSLSDTFYSQVEGWEVPYGDAVGHILKSRCGSLFQPGPHVFHVASAFIRAHLPAERQYAALHFRRMDFREYLASRRHMNLLDVPSTVKCLMPHLRRDGLTSVFVAAYALKEELEALRSAFKAEGITTVLMDDHRDHVGELSDLQVALVEKVVCAHALQFTYQPWSTFSWRILQLRHGLGLRSPNDEGLCGGKDFASPGNHSLVRPSSC